MAKKLKNPDRELPKKAPIIIKRILDLKVKGYTTAEILEDVSQTFNLRKGYVRRVYLVAANKILKRDTLEIADTLRESQLAKYMSLYKEAKESGDIKAANAILANIDKLFGLQIQKVESKDDLTISFE